MADNITTSEAKANRWAEHWADGVRRMTGLTPSPEKVQKYTAGVLARHKALTGAQSSPILGASASPTN